MSIRVVKTAKMRARRWTAVLVVAVVALVVQPVMGLVNIRKREQPAITNERQTRSAQSKRIVKWRFIR